MRLWHNTEDAPRLPQRVLEGERVEVWVASYPIEPWHHVMVEWSVTHTNGKAECGRVPAFGKCSDPLLRQLYWLATLGPFQQGDKVEYAIVGRSVKEETQPQTFTFNIEEEKENTMSKDPVCGMNVEERTAAATSTFNGATYFFCAPGCKRLFDRDPTLFVHDSANTLEAITKPLTRQILGKSNHKPQGK